MDNRKRYDVFISYSSEDQKVVEGICGYLERMDIRCFVAYRDIPSGVVWAKAITEALDASAMMVVVFSNAFNVSVQTDREIELASENKIPILTYRVEDAEMEGAKKYYLKNLNWIDAFPNPEKSFGHLCESVRKLLNQPSVKKNDFTKRKTERFVRKIVEKEREEENLSQEGTSKIWDLRKKEMWEKTSWGITIGMSLLLLVSLIIYCYCRIVGSGHEMAWGTLALVSISVGVVTSIVAGLLNGDDYVISGVFFGITLLMAAIFIVSLVIICVGWVAETGHKGIWNLLCLISLCVGVVSLILGELNA